LDGPTGEFAGGGDSSGFDTGEDLAIGGLVGGLLQSPGQEEGLFEEESFRACKFFCVGGLGRGFVVS
jgi:hypothetical protein